MRTATARAAWITIWLLAAVAGCGDGGDGGGDAGVSVECQQLASQLAIIAAGNRTCQVDSDCRWVADGCLGECATFINSAGLDAANAVIAQATADACAPGCICMALKPACNRGVCGLAMPRSDGGM